MCEKTLWNNTSTANCESYSAVDGQATTVRPACCQYFYFLFYSFVGDEANTENIAFQVVVVVKWMEL